MPTNVGTYGMAIEPRHQFSSGHRKGRLKRCRGEERNDESQGDTKKKRNEATDGEKITIRSEMGRNEMMRVCFIRSWLTDGSTELHRSMALGDKGMA